MFVGSHEIVCSLVGASISMHFQVYKIYFFCHLDPPALNGHIFLTSQPFALIQMVMDLQLGALQHLFRLQTHKTSDTLSVWTPACLPYIDCLAHY
jgi:hypothetical protein